MAIGFKELKCPHLQQTPPRSPAWTFVLGDDHKLLLCRECMDQITGAFVRSSIDNGIRRGAKRLLRGWNG